LFSLIDVPFPVIFTTAYDQYAIQVFQVHAIGYLLKPIKRDELSETILKLERFGLRSKTPALDAALHEIQGPVPRLRFVVKTGRTMRVVNSVDISYFLSENKITYLTCFDGRRYAIDDTLDQLESNLNADMFYRASRQCIVNIKGIDEMHVHSRSRLRLTLRPPSAQEVIVSTGKTSAFKEWLRGDMS
jgi:DNA-binding LytR/AlgR family response regulator